MIRAKRLTHDRGNAPNSAEEEATRAVLAIAGTLLSLLGAVLFAGGYLSSFSGSAFHMLVGAKLIVTGVLVARRHRAGLWTYLIVLVGTFAWSLREVDSGSSLAFRLAGPMILLAILATLMPVLRNWRPRQAARAFVGLSLATIAVGVAASAYGAAILCTPTTDCSSGASTRPVPDALEKETNARAY